MRAGPNYSASATNMILAMLGSGRSVRRYRSLLAQLEARGYKKGNLRSTVARMKLRGYLKSTDKGFMTTRNGTKEAKKLRLFDYLASPFDKEAPANTIISFDIPEKNRVKRNWLRNQIKIFGYTMLQQSLWIGPGSLPKEFMKRLEDLKIRSNVKTFRIKAKE